MGPVVHFATLNKLDPYFNFSVGNPIDSIEADLAGPSHGYDVPKNTGNILQRIEDTFNELKTDRSDKLIRRLVHYFCDALSIGQIGGKEFWEKTYISGRVSKDGAIDFACEFVTRKNINKFIRYEFLSLDEAKDFTKEQMYLTYKIYYPDSKDWFKNRFVTPKEVTHMTRRAVALGASIAYGWLNLLDD